MDLSAPVKVGRSYGFGEGALSCLHQIYTVKSDISSSYIKTVLVNRKKPTTLKELPS